MIITPTAKLLQPLKDSLEKSENDRTYLYAHKLGHNKFCDILDPNNPGEYYHTAFRHKGKAIGCNYGDEIIVVATTEEVDTHFAHGVLAVTQEVADAMVAAGADILEE